MNTSSGGAGVAAPARIEPAASTAANLANPVIRVRLRVAIARDGRLPRGRAVQKRVQKKKAGEGASLSPTDTNEGTLGVYELVNAASTRTDFRRARSRCRRSPSAP